MPRVRWLVPVLCINLIHVLFGIDIVRADCWYENEKHDEGAEVATSEPCLNCTCSRGALVCYLRVCPRLPNPPPPGCILLHRYKSCCPELICSDIPSGNGIEARSELEPNEILEQQKIRLGNGACMYNGSIYGPGSAMDSSSQCEYCYCLGGAQRCVKPKCLLPLDGCVPAYESNDCCPVHYNCTTSLFTSTTTTTLAPHEYETKGGCVVDDSFYPEGGKVLGVGHSICDNCYCLRGLVRCEPLSCAPPLLGCAPVIRAGECCAASYNCSGTIETQPEPNYGQFPTVSKEYAKLRKEVQHKRTTNHYHHPDNAIKSTENTNSPYYVIAETTKYPKRTPTDKPFIYANNPYYYNLTGSSMSAMKKNKSDDFELPKIYYVETKVESFQGKNQDILTYDSNAPATTIRHKKYTSPYKIDADYLEGRINRRIGSENDTISSNYTAESITTTEEVPTTTAQQTTDEISSTLITSTQETITPTTTDVITTSSEEAISTTTTTTEEQRFENTTGDDVDSDSEAATTEKSIEKFITIVNTTDCTTKLDNQDELADEVEHRENNIIDLLLPTDEAILDDEEVTSTTLASTITFADDYDNKGATISPKLVTDIETILNATKSKESDYDYDYNAPTLPPSLPNLRIIPFVAADALDTKEDEQKTNNVFQPDESFPFNNLFSPPAETEGGFIPKEPLVLDNFYEKYHMTNVGGNAVTSLPVPALTNPPKTNDNNCIVDKKEVEHGEAVNSEGTCAICVCFYGSIVCHEPQCPIPNSGCRNSNNIDRSTCCPHIICDKSDESPTIVVLERADDLTPKPQVAAAATVADAVLPTDPFRDVIRTEPAPDLELLMGDMSNYLLKQSTTSTTTISSTTFETTENRTQTTEASVADNESFSLDKIWQFLFAGDLGDEKKKITTPSTTTTTPTNKPTLQIQTANHNFIETRENINENLVKQDHTSVGLLKLAGCNIYGRMYRVGRIISELSGPCMECKCTEIGVQCQNLKC